MHESMKKYKAITPFAPIVKLNKQYLLLFHCSACWSIGIFNDLEFTKNFCERLL